MKDGLRNEVLTFFVSVLQRIYPSIPVRRAKQAIPATNELNFIVDLMSERSVGNEVFFDVSKETTSVAGMVIATLDIKAIGDGAVEMLSLLKCQLEQPSMVDLFEQANIAVNDVMQVQDVSMALDGRTWQEQGVVDLTISYSREFSVAGAEWFNKLSILGTVTNKKNEEEQTDSDEVIVDVKINGDLVY